MVYSGNRLWLQNEEDLTSNFFTSALAFRLLRMHGYGISSGIFFPYTFSSCIGLSFFFLNHKREDPLYISLS